MRIVIDLQGAQSESRFRGVGRYSLALALAVARNAGEHEVWLLLNGALADAIPDLRHAFADLVPSERVCVFEPAVPVAALAPANGPRARASELLREHVLAELEPDMVLVTSLFEGYVDDSVTSIGCHLGAERTAAILYDLIPLLNPAAYLPSATQQDYYQRKIASLKRAGLLLAISDYSRQEALDALALPPQQVVAISTAVDAQFHPAPLADAEQAALRQRFGLTRAMLMYAPGGFDARKNIDGLITAFSLLPPAVRGAHQLLVASKVGEHDRAALLAHARRCGLAADELVLTGYVDDATLIALYRSATLFIFPSKHEGFGLPALEAMACGAPVIGADNTSIPEVIGCAEALFDAGSPAAMAAKLAEVLDDPAMLERLRVHGRQQAAKFSWDISARRALRAMEQHVATLASAAAPVPAPARKPRLAFVSPLPPERTGIADYAAQLLPALMDHFEIELVLKQDQLTLPPALAALPRRTVDWFADHGAGYDHILYQFGNSPFHSHMFPLLRQHPGVVVLHDFFLSSVLVYEQLSGLLPHAWSEALAAHGYPALRAGLGGGADAAEAAKRDYPGNLPVLRDATHVIVHSDHARVLARQWYGPRADRDWSVVPLPRATPAALDDARAAARTALGIRPGTYLVCSFGFIAPTKLTHELVQAWLASSLHDDPACELVLVGANHGSEYGLELTAMLSGAAGRRIRIAGWTDEADYQRYLQAADAAVQLRAVSRGETSAAVLDCMNYGLPTIVNANGSMAALPDDCVLKLDDAFAPAALTAALETLHGDAALRAAMGARAAALLRREHSPEHCAALYAQVLAKVRPGRQALLRALAEVDGLADDGALQRQLACAIAAAPDPLAPRQLLVDVTTIARHDLRTGIERVVRAELLELLQLQPPGWRVEPVYLVQEDGRWQCRYARQYAYGLLGLDARATHDPVADVRAGDVYYGADFAPGPVGGAAADGLYARWRARGVHVSFVLYDLLPVLRPEFFPPGADAGHAAWLATIAAEADRLVCISHAVADDMRGWLERHPLPEGVRRAPLQLTALHLGADLAGTSGQANVDDVPHPLLPALRARPSFLMVGTIEPRKGHLQALAAFESLWAAGVDVQLVIVGNEGWKPLPAAARRTIPTIVQRLQQHPEQGRRLHWLQGLDDAALEQVYGACACLLQPSEGEGFGLPLIEAASRGLPLLARDIPVFREVARDGASYFSGLDGADLARAVGTWLAEHAAGRHPKPDTIRWRTWRETAAELLDMLAAARQQPG
ncbi:glycosyltransferase [Duganella sp. FT3S]|uniref:Glycosyltransferase n=1 Tax=Rugamonas fusca TaxID=2758568 RepID=A0A7W2EMF2_9BURK|nr:glycosyltransferase [Rugamonas fusca]MBA5608617.1 glycosyltransferase [Rugamonas fusca]